MMPQNNSNQEENISYTTSDINGKTQTLHHLNAYAVQRGWVIWIIFCVKETDQILKLKPYFVCIPPPPSHLIIQQIIKIK